MLDFLNNTNPILCALLATIFTWFVTALGAGVVFFVKKVNKTFMDGMLGFAAGVMIAASYWSLLAPAIDMATNLNITPWLIVFLGFISGGLILYLGDNIYSYYIEKQRNDISEKEKISFKRVLMLIFSITLHNIPEGLAVGVAFGSVYYGMDGATITAAIMLAIGIGLQNFPEGSAVSLPLRREGYSRKRAFFFGQASGIVEPIAGVLGAVLAMKMQFLLPFLLAFAAGAMIYVVIQELIPESQTNKSKDLMAIFSLIGFSVMMILDVALG